MSTSPASINTMVSSNNLCIQPATCGRMTTLRASREDATKLYLLPIKQSFSENMLQVRIHAWLDSSGIQDGPTGSGADRIVGAIRPGVPRGDADYAAMT